MCARYDVIFKRRVQKKYTSAKIPSRWRAVLLLIFTPMQKKRISASFLLVGVAELASPLVLVEPSLRVQIPYPPE